MSIEKSSELVGDIADLASLVGAAMEDGKLGVSDLGELLSALPKLAALAQIDYPALYEEVKALSPDEAQALADLFCQRFDIPQDSVEAKLEAGLGYVKQAMEVYMIVQALIKAVKK